MDPRGFIPPADVSSVRTPHNDTVPEPQGEPSLDPPRELPGPVPCPPESPPKIALSRDQQRILDHVKQGRSVFFTGSAGDYLFLNPFDVAVNVTFAIGTGKSVLLRAIIDHFGGGPSNRLAITASTGIAAVNIGGCTLHSWAGIGLGKESESKLYYKLRNCEAVKERWQLVRTLIIDESNCFCCTYIPGKCLIMLVVSMIDGTLFDKLVRL